MEVLFGTLSIKDHPILQQFNHLWKQVAKDNNSNRNYKQHIATWYGPVDYKYTGVIHKAQDMHLEFKEIAKDLEDEFNFSKGYFNSLLINLYTNKGIAPHADNEPIFLHKDKTVGAVATISLGEKATVTITSNDNSIPPNSIITSNSTYYIMPAGHFQNTHKHSVSASQGRRISLTFRHVPKENK